MASKKPKRTRQPERAEPVPAGTVEDIYSRARDTLGIAYTGLEEFTQETPPIRRPQGLVHVIVYGRAATFALQGMKHKHPDFGAWYEQKQDEMRADPLMAFFRDLRNQIEKEGRLTTKLHEVRVPFHELPASEQFRLAPDGTTTIHTSSPDGEVRFSGSYGTRTINGHDHQHDRILTTFEDGPGWSKQWAAEQLAEAYLSAISVVLNEACVRFCQPETSKAYFPSIAFITRHYVSEDK